MAALRSSLVWALLAAVAVLAASVGAREIAPSGGCGRAAVAQGSLYDAQAFSYLEGLAWKHPHMWVSDRRHATTLGTSLKVGCPVAHARP